MAADKSARQVEILEEMKRAETNFKKDSASRKTPEYLQSRLERLEALWEEAQRNHDEIEATEEKSHPYYLDNVMAFIRSWYFGLRQRYLDYQEKVGGGASTSNGAPHSLLLDRSTFESKNGKVDALIVTQKANFRALKRAAEAVNLELISEKWEIEDKLKTLCSKWQIIDTVHLQIDEILDGEDTEYYEMYNKYEFDYEKIKRELNLKLNSSIYQQQSMPRMEIPTFDGNYNKWPTFMDMYVEAIHKNPALTKVQKMQHLKGRLRGEAEKLVQHLTVAGDNYDTCWDLLTHRFNNKQFLFTKHVQAFMRQPALQKQSASELKRFHATSMEAIHAIHNLGVETLTWDPLLVHILCEKLDGKTYSDYMDARADPRELPSFDEFMTFIDNKFLALEPLETKNVEGPETKGQKRKNPHFKTTYFPHRKESRSYRQHNTVNFKNMHNAVTRTSTCPHCKNEHALFHCKKFIDASSSEKLKIVTRLKLCTNCLHAHGRSNCRTSRTCQECNETHHTLLHDALAMHAPSTQQPPKSTPSTSANSNAPHTNPPRQGQSNCALNDEEEVLLATALVKVRAANGDYITLRALIDQGSQITLITENAAQRLGLKRDRLHASVSGVGTLSNNCRGKVDLWCKSVQEDFHFNTKALVMSRIVNNLPNASFEVQNWEHVTGITLADPDYNISRPVDILLDADVYAQILLDGIVKGQDKQPMAQQTKLGWILSGSVKTYNCQVVTHNMEDLTRYWEVEEVSSSATSTLSTQDQYCEDHYNSNTTRLPDGRYVVRIPMKPNYHELLGQSKPKAIAQFKQLERRFEKDQQLSESYKQFMQEYLQMSHMKEATGGKKPECYLPHHGVIRQDSLTTKLRTVFNASMKTASGYSLNDLMECGPKLHQDLQALLIKWRLHKYVFTADCEKMYRMIMVHEDDQPLQKIVWRESPSSSLKDYQLCTVTYGTKAAPYLALRTLRQLAQDDAHLYPLAAHVINNEMYVDDVISGSNDIQQAKQIQTQLINMFKGAGFNLRKWASNESSLLDHISVDSTHQIVLQINSEDSTKALGLRWNPNSDNFTFVNKTNAENDRIHTKRTLLSEISKIFDPLGWLLPVTVKAKLLFQQIWLLDCEWDTPLPDKMQDNWKQLSSDLQNIKQFDIPRWLGDTRKQFTLHAFCDASEKVYACAVYICTETDDNVKVVRLIAAKSKLAPVNKKMTLPRLELSGALLLARLLRKIKESFGWEKLPERTYAWTDSMIVLGWLQGEPTRWKQFVHNRVQEIKDVVPKESWQYVKSEENAADCATRGLTSTQLLNHQIWWQGPAWLKNYDVKLVPKTPVPNTECEAKRIPTQSCTVRIERSALILQWLDANNNMAQVTRSLAWVRRFINNVRNKQERITQRFLTGDELKNAEKIITREIQGDIFKDEITRLKSGQQISTKSNILSLSPFLDDEGILRVGGRLRNSSMTRDAMQPMIVPHNCKLTDLLISQAHHQTLHGGPKLTLTHLRQRFWVVGGYRAVKRVLHKCVTCRRFSARKQEQIMADLPKPRVTVSRPFTHTGVDFTGHVEVKANKGRGSKTLMAYIAIFVCLATKAVHLEIVSDLSSTAFLAALKRFCARRGKPTDMYSDNGTNFVGANRILLKQYKEVLAAIDSRLLNKLSDMGINWHFNAPAWPSAGGLWESAVKSMKHHLKRVVGTQKLTFEEYSTLLCEIEACLNSRPLCTVTESKEDIDCLTPGHFLVGSPIMTLPATEQEHYDLRKRWQLLQKLSLDFWRKWSSTCSNYKPGASGRRLTGIHNSMT